MSSSRSSQTAVESDSSQTEVDFHEEPNIERRLHVYLPQGSHQKQTRRDGQEGELLKACTTRSHQKLRDLLDFANSGRHSVYDSDLMLTKTLFVIAIERKDCEGVHILLSAYPSLSMRSIDLLRSAFANPDLEIFKLLYDRSPEIINMGFDDHFISTAFWEACSSSDPTIPNFFLDHGVDAREGGFAGMGPLYKAMEWGQPSWLIKRMVAARADVSSGVISIAIKRNDPYLLSLVVDRQPDGWDVSDMRDARATGNEAIIAMVEDAMTKDAARRSRWKERQEALARAKAPKARGSGNRWWRLGK